MSAQPARKLPPGVLDIHAPQFPLQPPQEDQPVPSPERKAFPRRAPLTALERIVVRYLREKVSFLYGAEHFVRRHGTTAILAALTDDVMVRHTHYEAYLDEHNRRANRVLHEWIPNPRLRSPAAYLNKILNSP